MDKKIIAKGNKLQEEMNEIQKEWWQLRIEGKTDTERYIELDQELSDKMEELKKLM